MIVGRKNELMELERHATSQKSELICVYGRRRVGKTYLVEQAFSNQFAFRATGLENGNCRAQLKSFHYRLREYGDTNRAAPADWFDAFSRLGKLLSSDQAVRSPYGRLIVFLDEFPWFATAKSNFPEAFGEFWNRYGAGKGDLVVIICGSATSWIISNVIENAGSLFDRVTCQLPLFPFSLHESEIFFQAKGFGWNRRQIAECQMIFGGLPYFLDLLNPNESLAWNIDRYCFSPNAMLRSESKKLLDTTLKKSPVYDEIMRCLAFHTYGMDKTKCAETLRIPKTTFDRAVEDLKKCGYVQEYKASHNKEKLLRIQLTDPFLLFHYHFLSEQGDQTVMQYADMTLQSGRFQNWRGHAFEILCFYHKEEIKDALGISGVRTSCFPWVSDRVQGGAQIDMVIERDDGLTNLCEMKYTDHPLSISTELDHELIHKALVFQEETGTKKALKIVLILAEQLQGTANREHISRILTLDDLFEP